jgi:hypothetical protein
MYAQNSALPGPPLPHIRFHSAQQLQIDLMNTPTTLTELYQQLNHDSPQIPEASLKEIRTILIQKAQTPEVIPLSS